MRTPPPPTDTPAGDLALAAKALTGDEAAAGPGAFNAQAADAEAPHAEPEQQQQAEAGAGGQQSKKRPRVVAT